MKKITMDEAYLVVGGFNWSASAINAIKGVFSTIYEIGQAFGSALRRLAGGNICSCK